MRDYVRPTPRPLRYWLRRIALAPCTEVACGVLTMTAVMGWAAWFPGY